MYANVHFSAQKQVQTKKRSSRPRAVVCTGRIIRHVFTVHNAEKEDI